MDTKKAKVFEHKPEFEIVERMAKYVDYRCRCVWCNEIFRLGDTRAKRRHYKKCVVMGLKKEFKNWKEQLR